MRGIWLAIQTIILQDKTFALGQAIACRPLLYHLPRRTPAACMALKSSGTAGCSFTYHCIVSVIKCLSVGLVRVTTRMASSMMSMQTGESASCRAAATVVLLLNDVAIAAPERRQSSRQPLILRLLRVDSLVLTAFGDGGVGLFCKLWNAAATLHSWG